MSEIIDKRKMIITVILHQNRKTLKQVLRQIDQFLSHFIAGKKPLISPLLHNNSLITDFKQKSDLYNNFFTSQCTTVVNNSVIPDTQLYNRAKQIYLYRLGTQQKRSVNSKSMCMSDREQTRNNHFCSLLPK